MDFIYIPIPTNLPADAQALYAWAYAQAVQSQAFRWN